MAATSMQAPITIARPARRSPYRFYVIGVLALIALLNTMDQSILSVTAPAIQAEFQLSDAQIGFLSSAFVVVYGLAALPAGYWVDRYSRRAIVGAGVALWSLCTLLTGFTHSYLQLFAARTLLGTGEATILPAGVSLLGDYFSKRDRGRAAGILQAALQVGLALGLIGGGLVAAWLGWRFAFYLATLPGLLLALLAYTMREPRRGSAEASGPTTLRRHEGIPRSFARLLHIRTFVAAVLANTFVLFASTGIGGFIAIYTTRQFGIELAQVGTLVGIPLLIGGLVGNTVGGWLIDWRSRRSARAHLEIASIASAIGALGMIAAFTATSPATFEIAFLVGTLAGNVGMPGLLAINQNVIIPSLRGSAVAIQQLASNMLGRAMGLLLIGLVSDQLQDLRLALLVLPPTALFFAALSAACGLASMPRDVDSMDKEWEQLTRG